MGRHHSDGPQQVGSVLSKKGQQGAPIEKGQRLRISNTGSDVNAQEDIKISQDTPVLMRPMGKGPIINIKGSWPN